MVSAAVVGACGGGDSHRTPPSSDSGAPDGDPSAAGGKVGSGGAPGNGGKSSTGGASAGGAGTGGATVVDAGAGGSGGAQRDAGPDVSSHDAALPPLVCNHVSRLDGGDAAIGQWRDWAARACAVCPGPQFSCTNAFPNGFLFDQTLQRLTFTLAPGLADVVSGTVSVYWEAFEADGGFVSGNATVPVLVSENTIVADLLGHVHAKLATLSVGALDYLDGCGTQATISTFRVQALQQPDAGPTVNLFCEQ